MISYKRVLLALPLLSILGLTSCVGSAVSDLLINHVDLTPSNPTIAVGATQQFMLSATYLDGMTDHESPTKTAWFVDNAAVATIDHKGVATAIGAGTANIKGSYHGNSNTTVLTVTAAAAAVASAAEGDSRVLTVTNLRTGQQLTFAANAMRDSISISAGGGGTSAASEREVSVAPERGPAWLAVDSGAQYLYVVNHTSESISVFSIDWKAGTLSAVPFSPFAAGAKPWSVAVDPDGSGVSVRHFEGMQISRFRVDRASGSLKPFDEN